MPPASLREKILARRSQFLLAAFAAAGFVGAQTESCANQTTVQPPEEPSVPQEVPTASATSPSLAPTPSEAAPVLDAAAEEAQSEVPRVCLSVRLAPAADAGRKPPKNPYPPAGPTICLSF